MADPLYGSFSDGNNANDGSSYANRVKDLTNGFTAARTAPGGTCRIMESPAPTSATVSATWTSQSATVTLSSALNVTIRNGVNAWTSVPDGNNSQGSQALRKFGASAYSVTIGAGFGAGLVAYYTLPGAPVNLSAYQQVSLWVYVSNGLPGATGRLSLRLCSDTLGVTTVHTIPLDLNNITGPQTIPTIGKWFTIVWDNGSALNASIQSIALYTDVDLAGAVTALIIDNVIACKAPGNSQCFTHQSHMCLPDSPGCGGTDLEQEYCPRSIDGVDVLLDQGPNSVVGGTTKGYTGSTQTVTFYVAQPVMIPPPTSANSSSPELAVQEAGTDGSPITYSGGWTAASSMASQTGWTRLSTNGGNGYGFNYNGKAYITAGERMILSRFYNGVNLASSSTDAIFNFTGAVHCDQNGLSVGNVSSHNSQGACGFLCNNGVDGFLNSGSTLRPVSARKVNGNAFIGAVLFGDRLTIQEAKNNAFQAISNGTTGTCYVAGDSTNGLISQNGTSGISALTNSAFGDAIICKDIDNQNATQVSAITAKNNARVWFQNHGRVAGACRGITDGGQFDTETTVRHTASGYSWKCSPTSSNRSATYPLDFPVARVQCKANQAVTVTLWGYRSNTAITAMIVAKGGMLAGVASDVTATMAGSATTWGGVADGSPLSITFTPTQAGVIDIFFYTYGGTTHSAYCDDITITGAETVADSLGMDLSAEGRPAVSRFGAGSGSGGGGAAGCIIRG